MTSFWLSFVISEAVTVAEAFVAVSSLNPTLKTALEQFIVAAQNVLAAI